MIATYQNGGFSVSIHEDGTKEREQTSGDRPSFPESVDLKITQYCDNARNCAYCHEMSNTNGKHGDLNLALSMWEELPAGVEIAIGGGNPLSHPGLVAFLEACKERGHICNLTVNQLHLAPFRTMLLDLISRELVKGLGISVRDVALLAGDVAPFKSPHIVYHLILGVHSWQDFVTVQSIAPHKSLLLGYKTFGWGVKYEQRNPEISRGLRNWLYRVPQLLQTIGVLSFDNLAIEQLSLKRYFGPTSWQQFYMGDDGTFTMYVDLVKREFARGSTSTKRRSIDGTISEVFQKILVDNLGPV